MAKRDENADAWKRDPVESGRRGGKLAQAKRTPEERKEAARRAASARWRAKSAKKKTAV